jgi:hypothetical protein
MPTGQREGAVMGISTSGGNPVGVLRDMAQRTRFSLCGTYIRMFFGADVLAALSPLGDNG